jgi:hypothetical protein
VPTPKGIAAKSPKEAIEAFNKVSGLFTPSVCAASAGAAADIHGRQEGCGDQSASSCRWARKREILQRTSGRSTRRQDVGLITRVDPSALAHPLRNSAEEAEKLAGQMIGSSLITKQTGADGRVCNAVRIAPKEFVSAAQLSMGVADRSC